MAVARTVDRHRCRVLHHGAIPGSRNVSSLLLPSLHTGRSPQPLDPSHHLRIEAAQTRGVRADRMDVACAVPEDVSGLRCSFSGVQHALWRDDVDASLCTEREVLAIAGSVFLGAVLDLGRRMQVIDHGRRSVLKETYATASERVVYDAAQRRGGIAFAR